MDACFTQKRNRNTKDPHGSDPEIHHPKSTFIPPEDALRMADLVEQVRPSQEDRKKAKVKEALADDAIEGNMKLPTSILNGCEGTFIAADENRDKASTKFHIDTGLMALLCRHDKAIYTVNMKTAGEKQFYFLTLLDRLFQEIPTWTTIGVLYDIGCQSHRTVEKWDFLSQYRDRITWALSVFHAYGHQWACQLLYHPRKRTGFGLTDGEGCERFWSSLKKLIPNLRVSGVRRFLIHCISPN